MSKSAEELKKIVKEKYSAIAGEQKTVQKVWKKCCCNSSDEIYNVMAEDYQQVAGYIPEADLGLGCGLPTKTAGISKGDTVIDLGSGVGNDCFIARHETGPEGQVIGIDFSDEMIDKARENAARLGFSNVTFHLGELEDLPVKDNTADVIISNCVLNLVPDKQRVFAEIFRVMKPGGHFSISDIVLVGKLPDAFRSDAELYAGCVAGAIQKKDYLEQLLDAGFKHVVVQKEKAITLPEEILARHLSEEEIKVFLGPELGIFSITVYGEKA